SPGIAASHRRPVHSITGAAPKCSSAILIVTGVRPEYRWENRLHEKTFRGSVQKGIVGRWLPGFTDSHELCEQSEIPTRYLRPTLVRRADDFCFSQFDPAETG